LSRDSKKKKSVEDGARNAKDKTNRKNTGKEAPTTGAAKNDSLGRVPISEGSESTGNTGDAGRSKKPLRRGENHESWEREREGRGRSFLFFLTAGRYSFYGGVRFDREDGGRSCR